jgi:hypothetical protein
VGAEKKVYSIFTFDSGTAVFDNSLAIFLNIHNSSKGIIVCIGSDSARVGEKQPGEKDNANRYHPWMFYTIY